MLETGPTPRPAVQAAAAPTARPAGPPPPCTRAEEPDAGAPGCRRASLASCERGAVMVLGALAAIFLVALLYYLAGIGAALVARERAQDAADALALASAIGFARGMNFIVFLNLIMAALVTLLLALKVVSVLLTALSLTLAGLSLFLPGFAGPLTVVEKARTVVNQSHRVAKRVVNPTLRALNTTAKAARWSLPPTTIAVSAVKLTREFDRDVAFTVPTRVSLPTETGKYDRLCQEAASNLSGLVRSGTDSIPLFGKYVGKGVDKLSRSSSRHFCEGKGSAPRHTVEFTRLFPRSPAGNRCEQSRLRLEPDSAACEARAKELSASQPNGDGTCAGKVACEKARQEARRVCDPSEGRSEHVWSQAQATETLVFEGGRWQRASLAFGATTVHNLTRSEAGGDAGTHSFVLEKKDLKKLPCAGSRARSRRWATFGRYSSEWRRGAAQAPPVCSERAAALRQLPRRAAKGTTRQIEYQAVRDVFACSAPAKEEVVLDSELTGASDNVQARQKAGMAPQAMEAGVALGSDTFALRSFAVARAPDDRPERMQRVALFGRPMAPPPVAEMLDAVGRVSVAQSEYYFDHDGSESPDTWMWQMKWRARLTRFRLPTGRARQQGRASASTPSWSEAGSRLGLGSFSLKELSAGSVH